MILYHGTNLDFGEIDLLKSKPNKDFGQGFYLSREYTQAIYLPTLVHNLRNMKGITFQYYFGTERALKILRRL